MNDLIKKAENFARSKHETQKRKMTEEPYINHPLAVSKRVSEFTNDPEVIAAALLHDTLEDTDTTEAELRSNFPDKVVEIVKLLTLKKERYDVPDHDEEGNKISDYEYNERKLKLKVPYIREELNNMIPDARLIKFCDRENNVSDLHRASKIFASRYARETFQILAGIKFHPSFVEQILIQSIQEKIKPFL